jgi:hypothetical protein
MKELSASGLADLAGTTTVEVQRLVELGILVARDGADPFRETDVQKVRLAVGCEQAGLPMEGIAAAIRAGRLSFAFLEASPFRPLGGALGKDLPAGQPGDRHPP